jgi:hypothetical protein
MEKESCASNYLKLLCLHTLYFSSQCVFFFVRQRCEYEWRDEEKNEEKKIRPEQQS